MSKQIDRAKNLLKDQDAAHLMGLFAQAGFEMRFIGGCVRDSLLERDIKDIDFATTSLPIETMSVLEKNGVKAIPTGFDHGTVTAVYNGRSFQITTLRADVSTDGRHAEVVFTKNWQIDAERRDFTINAFSLDAQGNFYDTVDGLVDLEAKYLRFIGDPARRIKEDYLRVLRYFRFSSQLNWKIQDDNQLTLCRAYASELKTLSRERIQAELLKLVVGEGCLNAVLVMRTCGIWKGLVDTPVDIDGFGNMVFLENKYEQVDALRRLISLIGLKNSDQLEKIAVLSNKERKRLYDIKGVYQYSCDNRSLTRQLYDYGNDVVKDFYYLQNKDKNFNLIDAWQKPNFPISAADVMPLTKGEGPLVGLLLTALENYWIEELFQTSKTDLLIMAEQFVNELAH